MQMPSLYNGVSGVKAHTNALSSVSDNMANLSTSGFKGTRANFSDVMASKIYTGTYQAQQVGNGAYEYTNNVMDQGSFETTDNPLDMAINGEGFFTLQQPLGTTKFYSRAGQFHLDKDGFLVNAQGYHVLGGSGGGLSDIQIPTGGTTGNPTSLINLNMNLDAGDTNYHTQATDIDPQDTSTYNYSQTVTVYDANGDAHAIATFYQRLDSYTGPTPAGSAHVWKAASFEMTDSGLVANPLSPNNVYYLHFDTDGHLVGSSVDSAAVGDSYTFGPGLGGAGGQVSTQMGETLGFAGAGGTAQTYHTTATVTFSGATLASDQVSIGGTTITLGANATATAAANDLASQVNANTSLGYYALANAGVVTLYAKSTGAAANVSASGANITINDTTTLSQLVTNLNNGQASTGALDLGALGAGDTVTINGTTFTQGVGVGQFTDAASLTALINGAGLGVTASSNGGTGVFLTANTVGLAGDAITLASTGGVTTSGTTLQGGLDDSATSLVQASSVNTGGKYYLRLGRTDTGAAATMTVATGNTLGSSIPLDFNTYNQTTIAADAVGTSEDQGLVQLSYQMGGTTTQQVQFDYNPDGTSGTTQSAGDSEVAYLEQDGLAAGSLEGLEVDKQGNILGLYTNGDMRTLGTVTLSMFKSPENLQRWGDNLWIATPEAGLPVTGMAGDETLGFGTIEGGSLENSNVDLAKEMVNLINYQRAYQANTKSITTSDEMLKTAINLKG